MTMIKNNQDGVTTLDNVDFFKKKYIVITIAIIKINTILKIILIFIYNNIN